VRRERKREGPTRVYEREEESVSMCVRRCVRNFEEEEEKITCKTLSKNRHLPILHTAHAYKEYIHTHIHPHVYIYTYTPTLVRKEKKREKNVRALLRRECMLSAAPVLLPRNTLCVSLL